ncbi:hypothetical protein BJ742DRAFT_519229 [Cladochytrium replicatum]|nr:hypothetical protein BJ742DRAFT_519229 [Cladochytrium replicatum]
MKSDDSTLFEWMDLLNTPVWINGGTSGIEINSAMNDVIIAAKLDPTSITIEVVSAIFQPIHRGQVHEAIAANSTELIVECVNGMWYKLKTAFSKQTEQTLCVLIDYTDEHRLQKEKEYWKSVVDLCPIPIFVGDNVGNLFYFNHEWMKMQQSLINPDQNIRDSMNPEEREVKLTEIKRAVDAVSAFDSDLRMVGRDGEDLKHRLRFSPNTEHEPPVFVGVQWDVSAQREAQEKAVKDDLRSQFFAIVSHEIRTPLTGIIGMLNVFPKGSNLSEDQTQCLETIDECSSQLMAIVNDVLDYSKSDAGQMKLHCEKVHIRSLLKLAKASFQAKLDEKNLAIEMRVMENVPEFVFTDPVRLRQIVFNLLSNSIKFSDHGSIQIIVENNWTTHPNVLWTSRSYIELKFSIMDEGIGIPECKWPSLFSPFSQVETTSTRRAGGTGLGLAICKKLVNLMSGDISLQKKSGPGTAISFTIIVELLTDEAQKAALEETRKEVEIHSEVKEKPVLVVEDNFVNQQFMHRLLKNLDFPNVHFANNGLEAVEMSKKTDYSAIFMDNQMPVMDGFEASRQILAMKPEARIACITGDTYEGIKDRYIALGVKAFLLKPFRRDALQELLRDLFVILHFTIQTRLVKIKRNTLLVIILPVLFMCIEGQCKPVFNLHRERHLLYLIGWICSTSLTRRQTKNHCCMSAHNGM